MSWISNISGGREWSPECFVNYEEGSDQSKCETLEPDHDDPMINNYRNYYNFEEWNHYEMEESGFDAYEEYEEKYDSDGNLIKNFPKEEILSSKKIPIELILLGFILTLGMF